MKIVHQGYDVLSASDNMQRDFSLISEMSDDAKIRFYSWKNKCVTYGYNQIEDNVKSLVNKVDSSINEFVRRPTGGGLIIHTPDTLSWTLIIPLTVLKNDSLLSFYYELSSVYAEALSDCGINCSLSKATRDEYREKRINDICKEYPAKYEIVDENGKKVIGSAQKKTKDLLIQQNNLFINEPCGFREKLLQALSEYFIV